MARHVPSLDETLAQVLHDARRTKFASHAPRAQALHALAEGLRGYAPPPLSYDDLHAVKTASLDAAPTPRAHAKTAAGRLRDVADGLRAHGHATKVARHQAARDVLAAGEALILLRQRRGT